MFKPLALTAMLVIAFAISTTAQQLDIYTFRGVRNSSGPRRLNERQLRMVQESLRQKSGFVELEFDRQGVLTLGGRHHLAGGSATARALLAAAVDSADLYELESHESSPEIAFAQIYPAATRIDDKTGRGMNIYQVRLDFADFDQLSGSREAKASFDLGVALLHELAHGVLKLQDPLVKTDEIGECDTHINQMRRELQLPERLYYYPDIKVMEMRGGRRFVSARLVFVKRAAANAKPSAEYSLIWWADQVSPNAHNIAGLQQGLLESRRR